MDPPHINYKPSFHGISVSLLLKQKKWTSSVQAIHPIDLVATLPTAILSLCSYNINYYNYRFF